MLCGRGRSQGNSHALVQSLPCRSAQFHPMMLQGQLEADPQLLFRNWLKQIAKWIGLVGPANGGVVGEGGEVNHRDVEMFPDVGRSCNAIHFTFQVDVHEQQIRKGLPGTSNSVLARSDDSGHGQPHALQPIPQFFGD